MEVDLRGNPFADANLAQVVESCNWPLIAEYIKKSMFPLGSSLLRCCTEFVSVLSRVRLVFTAMSASCFSPARTHISLASVLSYGCIARPSNSAAYTSTAATHKQSPAVPETAPGAPAAATTAREESRPAVSPQPTVSTAPAPAPVAAAAPARAAAVDEGVALEEKFEVADNVWMWLFLLAGRGV